MALVVLGLDPDEPGALATLLLALGAATTALAAAALHYVPGRLRVRRQRPRPAVSLRRGALTGVAVVGLAYLASERALSPLTAGFLIAALLALEGAFSARS